VGELDRAAALVEETATLREGTGPAPWDTAGLARAQSELALRRGDPARAAAEARAALEQPHSDRGRARLQNQLGIALAAAGDLPGAVAAFEEELAAASAAGMETYLATTHGNLAEARLQLGDEASAAGHQEISLELARALGQLVPGAFSMMIAARLVAARDNVRQAVVLQAAADAALADAAYALFDEDARIRDEMMSAAREQLGEEDFDRALGQGRGLDHDAAADLAAEVLAQVRNQSTEQEAMR
jgi:tetratricopeptide (TPR) repeat protein